MKQSKSILTIRKSLSLLVVACIAPTIITTASLVYFAYGRERASGERLRVETARALMQAVDRELSSAQGTLQALATSPYLTSGDLAAFYAQAKDMQRFRPDNNFVLIDAKGLQLVNTLRPFGAALPPHGNQAQLRRIFETARPVISDLYLGGVARRPLISVDVPVLRNNQVRFDLSMGFFPEHLIDILRLQRIPADWVATIFDSNGVVVARTWDQEKFIGHKGAGNLVQRMRQVSEDSIETTTLEGVPVISAFSRSAVSKWAVAIGIPQATITRDLWTSVGWIIGAAALSLLAGLLLAKIVANRIAGSIYQLLQPAAALGHGEQIEVPVLRLKEANEVAQALAEASRVLRMRTVERDVAERAEQELRSAQQQLEHSYAFQRRLFDEAPNAIILVARSGRIVRANAEAGKIFGYENEQLLALSAEDLMPGEFKHRHETQREAYFSNPVRRSMGSGMHLLGRHSDGTEFPVDVMLSPLQTAEGMLVIAIVRDITERLRNEDLVKAALREKETLLKEIYHRVKNNLQVIASMIKLQERAAPGEATRIALTDAADRVRAMALVHEKLYQSSNLSSIALDDYISDLCKQLGAAAAADQRGIGMVIEAAPVQVGLDIAIPLGLVLNELISNCLKHAFPDGRRGTIVVCLKREAGETMRLTVADDGVGLPATVTPTSSPSLGLKLIAALTAQLDGQFSLESRQGALASLVFPLAGQEKS